MKHSLHLHDRGDEHRHRWLPQCTCGHPFIPLRDKGRAADAYHAHVRSEERAEHRATVARVKRSTKQRRGRRTRTAQAGPRPVTPHEQLPPELQ